MDTITRGMTEAGKRTPGQLHKTDPKNQGGWQKVKDFAQEAAQKLQERIKTVGQRTKKSPK